jgi:hypothetical protein
VEVSPELKDVSCGVDEVINKNQELLRLRVLCILFHKKFFLSSTTHGILIEKF